MGQIIRNGITYNGGVRNPFYDNAVSGLASKTFQEAIDELYIRLLALEETGFCTVTYVVDTDLEYTVSVPIGKTCLKPTEFNPADNKPDFDFMGWRYDNQAIGEVLSRSIAGVFPVILYAVYRKKVTITYEGNGETSGSTSPQTGFVYYNNGNTVGASFTLASSGYTKTNYLFTGWDIGAAGSSMILFEDVTAKAQWYANTWAFNYTGGIQTFTVPVTGNYRLETYGAQGYHTATYAGTDGKGGYAKGTKYLEKDTVLHVVVGGRTTGYNGGGYSSASEGTNRGGGATHIATRTGLLSALSSYKSDILIAAGGGGSACYYWCYGGAGGGTTGGAGYYSYNGTTTNVHSGGTQSAGYAFGTGQSGSSWTRTDSYGKTHNEPGPCGGGGYYGGRASSHDGGGSGGSGYVGGVLEGTMSNGSRSGDGYSLITLIKVVSSSVTYYVDSNQSYTEGVSNGASCLSPTTFTPTKSGYTFVGWRKDTTASGNVETELTMGEDPITLYAVFKKAVTLSYHGSGATGSVASQSGDLYYNCGNMLYPTLTVANNEFTWNEYTFECWKTSSKIAYNPGDSITISANTTLYAYWPDSSLVVYTSNMADNPQNNTVKSIMSDFVSVSAPGIAAYALTNVDYNNYVYFDEKTLTINLNYGSYSKAVIVFKEYNENAYDDSGTQKRSAKIQYPGESSRDSDLNLVVNKTTTSTSYSVKCTAELSRDYTHYTWCRSGVHVVSITLQA